MSFDFNPGRGAREQDRPVPWKFRLGLCLLGPAAWLLQIWAARHPGAVERLYSGVVYPILRDVTSTFTGFLGFSLVEFALILVTLWLLWRAIRNVRRLVRGQRSLRNMLAHLVSGGLALSGLLAAWGILGWGLNYHRQPFAVTADLDVSPASADELQLLCEQLAVEAAVLRRQVEEDLLGVMRPFGSPHDALERVRQGFDRVGGDYPLPGARSVTRAKPIWLPVLPWLGIGGVFSMYTQEPNVNMEQPPAGVLASACHEVAHQLGWAREDEASFVGYVACRAHPDTDFRYAVTQSALSHALRALSHADSEAARVVYASLEFGVLRDWEAASEFWASYQTPIADAADRVNDAYLKSQGQEAGLRSYGMMVELLIGDLRRGSPGPTAVGQ